jgi:hypothetical protein
VSVVSSQPEPSRVPRRRTVRIVKPRRISNVGLISILLAVAAAILLLLTRQAFRSPEPLPPTHRTIFDVELEWKCDAGHTFKAAGQITPRKCWTCRQPAYPIGHYACPTHGTFEVAGQYEADDSGAPRLSFYRVYGGTWTPVGEGLKCPRCGQALTKPVEDPLTRIKVKKP